MDKEVLFANYFPDLIFLQYYVMQKLHYCVFFLLLFAVNDGYRQEIVGPCDANSFQHAEDKCHGILKYVEPGEYCHHFATGRCNKFQVLVKQ